MFPLRELLVARRQRPMVVANLLAGASGVLEPLMHRAAGLQAEEARLRALLDTEVSEQVDAVYLRGDSLVVLVRSSVWATRLRFLAPALLQRVQRDGGSSAVRHVRVAVSRGESPASSVATPRPTAPSAEAAKILSQSAATFPADDPLRLSLERLASRTDRRGGD